jgi:hypothetical protein
MERPGLTDGTLPKIARTILVSQKFQSRMNQSLYQNESTRPARANGDAMGCAAQSWTGKRVSGQIQPSIILGYSTPF